MPSQAYILIEGAAGKIPSIHRRVTSIDGVCSCHAVTGQFDLVALVEGQDINELGKISYAQIQMLDGVIRTVTCNVIEF
ncbi:MAG: Lrp/AsnC ligand binding domain-containing protein [Deltaproteobacteria bacterium]|nr:Lrp/AsnC ligand binding domain-containing protein [Deltaproteobacteria bacterium]